MSDYDTGPMVWECRDDNSVIDIDLGWGTEYMVSPYTLCKSAPKTACISDYVVNVLID